MYLFFRGCFVCCQVDCKTVEGLERLKYYFENFWGRFLELEGANGDLRV